MRRDDIRHNSILSIKKLNAALIATILTLLVSASALFLAVEVNHDCGHEEDCPICGCIQICLNTLGNMSDGSLTYISSLIYGIVAVLTAVYHDFIGKKETLVSYKIRLND